MEDERSDGRNEICCVLPRTMLRWDPGAIAVRNAGLGCVRTEGRGACSVLGVKGKCRSCMFITARVTSYGGFYLT